MAFLGSIKTLVIVVLLIAIVVMYIYMPAFVPVDVINRFKDIAQMAPGMCVIIHVYGRDVFNFRAGKSIFYMVLVRHPH